LGTMVMIPTFTEILLVREFMGAGLSTGAAVAILISAPAVSLPSLIVVGSTLKDYKVPLLLGILIFLLGVVGGLLFAAI
ncbi:MAG: permease, partial [Dehalococcoidia bacterium]|nr:permease [Dehalococcoidia bacterium]